ncbi:MAG TPA: RNA methyltransferase, partial [Candidatus Bathyarchaeia archaeon]|nr:RNA methyltransferase [Candidatus Bathyarchaeia archaeon]
MNISIISVFPSLYTSFLETSLIKKAQEKNLVTIAVDPFMAAVPPKERIDAPTYGPGAGMLMRPDVVEKAIETREKEWGQSYKIFFSPQGKKLDQRLLHELYENVQKKSSHIMLIASRYEGMDARVEEYYADSVISVGDFILMGGDLPAMMFTMMFTMMFIEGFLRLIPGVVGKKESVDAESFSGPFIDFPAYTEPVMWKDKAVPDIVRSGNHGAIAQWRKESAAKKTVLHHFSWLRSSPLTQDDKALAAEYIPHHYVVLMHDQVLIGPEKKEGVSSVTSLDVHDIARSACTYGIKHFFIVTPLRDQQQVVQRLLDFWTDGPGIEYNKNRHEAVRAVSICSSLDEAMAKIEMQEGKKPICIATSARTLSHDHPLSFYDQEMVW